MNHDIHAALNSCSFSLKMTLGKQRDYRMKNCNIVIRNGKISCD